MASKPNWRQLLRNPVHLLAFGFGAGLSPKAPGTIGTLIAIPGYLLLYPLSREWYLTVVLVISVIGIWLCGRTARDMAVHDHAGIVWDEIAGFLLSMAFVGFSWPNLVLGFVLFRLFDILKPWPISFLDRTLKGGIGIMLDDIVAGLFAGILLYFAQPFIV